MAALPHGPGPEKDQARFYAKVALPNEQGCMLWLKGTNGQGYGKFWLDGRTVGAHRFSYVLAYGPVPEGLHVDHVKAKGCTNRHCVAPDHLEAVTPGENIRRGDTGSNHRTKTHCPQGHPYSPENTHMHRNGSRRCRECGRRRWRAWHRRKRADTLA